jgi:hypothetical protein
MGLNWRICVISRRRLRDLVLASLLACASWLILMPIWIHASPGGLTDKIIGGMFHVPYRAGKHLAHVLFPDSAARSTTRYYLAPMFGVAGEILLLTAVWLAGFGVVRLRQARKNVQP